MTNEENLTALPNVGATCITTVKTAHGKWSYYAVVRYRVAVNKEGKKVWYRDGDSLVEATTSAKIERLAKEVAANEKVPFFPHVRHTYPVTPEQEKILAKY